MVDLLSLVNIFEEVRLHVLAPGAAPLGAVLPHQPEAGIGDDALHDGRSDVRQLPAKLLPELSREGHFRNFVMVDKVDVGRHVREEGTPQRVNGRPDNGASDPLQARGRLELGLSEAEGFEVFADERGSVGADGGASGDARRDTGGALVKKQVAVVSSSLLGLE